MKKITTLDRKFAAIVLGFVAAFMIVLPALSANGSDNTYTGLQVVFGHEFINLGGFGSGAIKFSVLNFVAYALPMSAALVLLLNKGGQMVSTLLFGAAAILLFLVPTFTVVTVTVLGNVTTIDIDWAYAAGLIIAIVLSMIGFTLGLYTIYKKS
ncbi:MAG: hypothetical protein ACNA7U_06190 [Candidatus Izemoplasmataceae bacterium]|jgi:hypothetical protein|uniref:hypothetical protein n=1 Tax=Liberiplasma polymorphum TaxID=3374570 RepID=UPI0037763F2D